MLLDIDLDVRQPRGAARAPAQRRQRRPRLLTTADGHGALTSTLCTLERCQRPRSASLADLLLVLDAPSARAEGTVVLNAIVTHTRSRNTCNVKSMISGPPRAGPRRMPMPPARSGLMASRRARTPCSLPCSRFYVHINAGTPYSTAIIPYFHIKVLGVHLRSVHCRSHICMCTILIDDILMGRGSPGC